MTTFADQLERLLSEFSAETNALKRFALGQQIDALLRNHAKEVAALVKAAEAVIRRWDTPHWKETEPTAHTVNAMRNALAALNKEKE